VRLGAYNSNHFFRGDFQLHSHEKQQLLHAAQPTKWQQVVAPN
jgi:hypothetical protein